MANFVKIGKKKVGDKHPVYIIGEIGLNHNGSLEIAKKLIDLAALAGCDAVKFQKRTPELCVPDEYKNVMRETPWGTMTYLEYRKRVEFGEKEYGEIDRYCKKKKVAWFASCWDAPSVDFIEKFSPIAYKVASASITDTSLIEHTAATGRPILMSSGMSTMEEIRHCASLIPLENLLVMHATSTYPCIPKEINLKMIPVLKKEFKCPIGYSGHEIGLQISLAAVVMGACMIERHITLDRAMWGSDHAASLEPNGLMKLVRDIRIIEEAMGDGVKVVYKSEMPIREKLRKKK